MNRQDKFLNNTGDELDNVPSGLRVDDEIIEFYEDQLSDDLISYRINKKLQEDMYEKFKVSKWYEKYKILRRLDNKDVLIMYYYFRDEILDSDNYTNMDYFICFAEFFQVKYTQLYNEVSVLDKENILREVNDKYKTHSKLTNKRLF